MWASEACKKRAERARSRDKAGTHPLAEARAQQEQADLKSKLSQIIYQGIVDRLKFGSVHADDLEPLFPPELRGVCRRLVGAQFGSLASRGYIIERERRKSNVPSRKGAKSGVFEFTKKGRETLVGNSSGEKRASSQAAAVSGESGVGVEKPQGPPGDVAAPLGADTASPDQTLVGVHGEKDTQKDGKAAGSRGSVHPGEKANTDVPGHPVGQGGATSSPSPCIGEGEGSPEATPASPYSGEPTARLFDDAPPSAFDPWSEAA